MKIRCVLCTVLLPLVGVSSDSLSSLTNEWGKGNIMDFHKKVCKVVPIVERNGGAEALQKWCQSIAMYPDMLKETGKTHWMGEKVNLLSYFARITSAGGSTNCWFAAAELLYRYRGLAREAESNANAKVDLNLVQTDPKYFNEIFYGRKQLKVMAWNLRCVETLLAHVVTNDFPKSVLPLLPESEWEKMMSDVLVQAGLAVPCNDEEVSADWKFRAVLIFGVVLIFVLVGSAAMRTLGRFHIGRKSCCHPR